MQRCAIGPERRGTCGARRHGTLSARSCTCVRRTTLQWQHVAFNETGEPRAFVLPPQLTKTDRERSVPISPRLRAILHLRRLDPDGRQHGLDAFVFGDSCGNKVSDVKLAWRGACQRAGIGGLTLHDLRREAASRLLQGGVDLLTVSQLLGHQRATTTDTYLRGREDVVQRQIEEYHERRQASR
jgi:integrase